MTTTISTQRRLLGFALTCALVYPAAALPQARSDTASATELTTDTSAAEARLRTMLLTSNPQLLSRRLAVAAARSRTNAAGTRPSANLIGDIDEIPRGIDLAGAGSLRVAIEQEIPSRTLRSAQKSAAASEVAIARVSLAGMEQRLLSQLHRDLIRLAGWSVISRRLASEDDLLLAAENSIRGRFAAGDARYIDVLRLRTERLRVQAERASAMTEIQAARVAVISLFGLEHHAQVTSQLGPFELGPQIAELRALPPVDTLLNRSPVLQLSRARLERANALRQLTLAEQGRRFSASLGAQRFRMEDGEYSVGPAIAFAATLPFTAGRANSARAQAAELDFEAQRGQVTGVVAMTRARVALASQRYEAARKRITVYETALLKGARDERESALASFRSGELSLIELLDFERALARAEIDRVRARIQAAEALADLHSALSIENMEAMGGE